VSATSVSANYFETLGIAPTTIWLADRGQGWELYSNGLRIETSYAVACITIFGLLALFTYPLLAHWMFNTEHKQK